MVEWRYSVMHSESEDQQRWVVVSASGFKNMHYVWVAWHTDHSTHNTKQHWHYIKMWPFKVKCGVLWRSLLQTVSHQYHTKGHFWNRHYTGDLNIMIATIFIFFNTEILKQWPDWRSVKLYERADGIHFWSVFKHLHGTQKEEPLELKNLFQTWFILQLITQ